MPAACSRTRASLFLRAQASLPQALDCDIFFTIGTSSIVYPAASLIHEAKRRGAFTIEMNVESTPASALLDLPLQGKAEDLLAACEDWISRFGNQRESQASV